MKAYVYLDTEDRLVIKSCEYIDNDDPNFFGNNRHWIRGIWKFDSENSEGFADILESFRRMRLPERTVRDFCNAAEFDLDNFLLTRSSPPKAKF